MVNHTLLLPNHLDAQPVLSLVRSIALLRNKYKDCQVEKRKIPLLVSRGWWWRVDRDAGEPAHRNHASTRRVELVFRFTSFHRLDDKGF